MRTLLPVLSLLLLAGCSGPSAPAPPPAAPPPAAPAPPPPAPRAPAPAPAFDARAVLTTPGGLEAFLADGGDLEARALLLYAVWNLRGAERDDAVDRLLAAGADPTRSTVIVFAARACATTAVQRLLDAGAEPNACLERRGSCVRVGGIDGIVYGKRPYTYAREKLDGLAEDDPERPACQATVDLLAPLTPLR